MSETTKIYSYQDLPEDLKKEALDIIREDVHEDYNWGEETDYISGALEEDYGLNDVKIEFTGFYSQGDGASFTGRVRDMGLFLSKVAPDVFKILEKTESLEKFNEVTSISFKRTGYNYVHSESCETEMENDDYEELAHEHIFSVDSSKIVSKASNYHYNILFFLPFGSKLVHYIGDDIFKSPLAINLEKLYEKIEAWRKKECDKIYRSLEKTDEDMGSDENIEEIIAGNDYKFEVELDEDGEPIELMGLA